jgi:O-antigen ligase
MNRYVNAYNLIAITPLFLLTIKGWVSSVVVLLFALAFFYFLKNYATIRNNYLDHPEEKVIALSLLGPLLAILISQIIRQDFNLGNIDLFLRVAFSSVIFLSIANGWSIQSKKSIFHFWTHYVFPGCLILTFLYRPAWTQSWGETIVTTYFVDPLTFGSLCLLLTIITLTTISFYWKTLPAVHRLFLVSAIMSGLYLSTQSGSRTGWFNLPIFGYLWISLILSKKFSKNIIYGLTFFILFLITFFAIQQPIFIHKIKLAIDEVSNYQWNAMNPDESVTMRISFLRMGIFYFLQNPLSGYGDLGWTSLMDSPELLTYASEFTRAFPKSGFHNEIMTSAVRSGIWGLMSSVFFFAAPIWWAIRNLKTASFTSELYFRSFIVLIYMLHLLISAMTTEVINLIFLASFHGFMIAIMIGEGIYLKKLEVSLEHNE